jgi:hypothetical protein
VDKPVDRTSDLLAGLGPAAVSANSSLTRDPH